MKKVLAILPLMTAVFLAPSCKVTIGWDDTKFEYATRVEGNVAYVDISWTSGAHLSFKTDKLNFYPDSEGMTVVETKYDGSGTMSPMTVKITFGDTISFPFTGRLDYTYTNIDTNANGDNQAQLDFNIQQNN